MTHEVAVAVVFSGQLVTVCRCGQCFYVSNGYTGSIREHIEKMLMDSTEQPAAQKEKKP